MCYSQILKNFGGDKYLCKLGKNIKMLYYTNLSFILYSILKLLKYHTFFCY